MTAGKPYQVRTKKPVKDDATPRMPHERDESEDSQASDPRSDIKRAYDDLMEGQVNTDLRQAPGVEELVRQHDLPEPPDSVINPLDRKKPEREEDKDESAKPDKLKPDRLKSDNSGKP